MTPPAPFPPSDHDVLIEVRTILKMTLDEMRELRERLTSQVSQKADKSEVDNLRKMYDQDRTEHAEIHDKLEANGKRVYWILGVLSALQFAVMIAEKLWKHTP